MTPADGTSDITLFAWQRAVIAAHQLTDAVRLTALRIALDSTSVSGRDVVVNVAQVAGDVGCSERTVWRRVQSLLDAGWMIQTTKPTYGGKDGRGRRARYQLRTPSGPNPVVCHDQSGDDTRLSKSSAKHSEGVSDDPPKSSDITAPNLAHDYPSRVPNQPKSSDTTTAPDGTLLPSCGSSNAAAAAREATETTNGLPPAVEILRGKLHARNLTVRWDKLTGEQLADIERLVDLHGDAPLLKAALNSYRPDSPPQFAQAWLGTWNALPAPGASHLTLVRPQLCDTHGVTLSPGGTCTSCAADAKAADR